MKRILLIGIVFLLYSINTVFAFSENDLDNLEISKYGKVYKNDNYGTRLRRLETDLLGMTQSGDIESRINILKQMNENSKYASFMYPDDNYYMDRNKKNGVKNFFKSMFDTGMITGYTPSMSSSYSNNIYGNEFMNFANNPYGYCPYNNGFNYFNTPLKRSVNRFHRFTNKNGFSSVNRHGNRFHSYPHAHFHPNNHYYSHYGIRNNYPIIPTDVSTNVATRSTVHILQD